MTRFARIVLANLLAFALVIFMLGVFVGAALAQERHDMSHARFHDFYRTWLRPDTGTSCCNMRETGPDGTMTGDCRATPFRVVGQGVKAHWQAKLDDGSWIDVPDDKIIHEHNPDRTGRDGHLCESYGTVYCAVPPTGTL